MAQVGATLRAARESRGLTLEDIEKATRIRRVLLEALENDAYDDLPSPVYTRGFIRNYAQLVGLDPEEMVAAYAAATGTPPASPTPEVLDEPLVQSPRGGALGGILWGIVIVLAIGIAGWYAYTRFYLGETPTLPSLPFLAPAASPEAGVTATPPSQAAVVTTPTDAVDPTAVDPTAVEPTEEPTATPPPTATLPPTQAVVIVTPTAVAGITVEARVTAATYVEVTADGERLLTTTLQAGAEEAWTGDEAVSLRVGNAGGISLTVNGVEVPPLGASGEVVTVEYTRDNLPEG
ncbi:MAG TPA: helix-turn-helix domain-containing protein [Chloroflexi bacterium]|nr:helix-turn-helix domain-containing protein [Chloroflexota bacterium]